MLGKTMAVFLAVLTVSAAVPAGDASDPVKQLIIDAAARGQKLTTYVDMAGQMVRARVKGATAEGLTVTIAGMDSVTPWAETKPAEMLRLALSVAGDSGANLLTLSRYALSVDLKDDALSLARKAATLDPAFRDAASEIEKAVLPPEPPRPMEKPVEKPKETPKPVEPKKFRWESVGIGGGGGLFSPASSPHDPNLMFVNCDMGHFYRSTDGGRNWRMYNFREIQSHTVCRPIFHPKDPGTAYTYCSKGLMVTNDRGETWRKLADIGKNVLELAIDLDNPAFMLAGTSDGVMRSMDAGATWQACTGPTGSVIGLFIDQNSPAERRTCFAGGTAGVFRSDDGGRTWSLRIQGLPGRNVRGFCGGADKARKVTALYCTLGNQGVFRSTDKAENWTQAKGLPAGREFVFAATAKTHPDVCYVTDKGEKWTVYKTTDGGETWASCFRGPARYGYSDPNVELSWLGEWTWGWGGPAIGFNVNHGNPDVAMYTNTGELYITQDGGKSWYQAQSGKTEQPGRWRSIGLEVTTCWRYEIAPWDRKYHFICYTDIGFCRSEDGGKSWEHAARSSPWGNTFYQMVFEPAVPGKAYAAASNVHDIGGWGYADPARTKGPGGVVLSEDFCRTWKASSNGLPNAPCTSILLDTKSPPQSRTLYCAMVGQGVYKSTDGAQTWTKKSNGLGTPENMHVYSLHMDGNGTLYCVITASRTGGAGGYRWGKGSGIWRSRNGGETWEWITASLNLGHALEMDIHPENPDIMLLGAIDLPGRSEGGLYMTTDGGTNWKKVLSNADFPKEYCGFVHVMQPTFHPKKPNIIYLTTWTHGLWVSTDSGQKWQEFKDMPASDPMRVHFDPDDENVIYVTTYGEGVWKGPALP